MKFGLSQDEYKLLKNIVIPPLTKYKTKIYCFGSRARGDFLKFSDIDLLIESEIDISNVLGEIKEALINSNFPYKVDIVLSKNLANSYKKNIENEKVAFT